MTDKLIADAVRKYWKFTGISQDVVAFFDQQYDFDNASSWEYCEELIESNGEDDFETVIFHSDFCEGQTKIRNLKIVPLWLVFACVRKFIKVMPDIESIAHLLKISINVRGGSE